MRKPRKKPRNKNPASSPENSSMNEQSHRERAAWLQLPRLHTAIFQDLARFEEMEIAPIAGFESAEAEAAFLRQSGELKHKVEMLIRRFGWSKERFRQLQRLAILWRENPSLENYLAIRREFPELDIQIAMSAGIDPLFALEDKCRQHGIDPALVAGAMDGFEPKIDKLCLILMERIVAREKINGVGAYQRRRAAISDAMVNYLIAFMLEGLDWCEDEVRMPASLILLIRHQLGPLKGEFHKEYESRESMRQAAWIAGQQLKPTEKLSINRLIKLASSADSPISRSTAARWLKNPEFQHRLEFSSRFDEIRRELFQAKDVSSFR